MFHRPVVGVEGNGSDAENQFSQSNAVSSLVRCPKKEDSVGRQFERFMMLKVSRPT